MTGSILLDVAEVVLGSIEEVDAFKSDLIIHINSALMTLGQIGVGEDYYRITGDAETWSDFVGDDTRVAAIQDYVTSKVKLAFDPPSSSAALESLTELIREMEWRLQIQADPVTRGDAE